MLLLVGLTACNESGSINSKLVLNEVLIENEDNYQDDYGKHSAWIEIFNRTYGSADLAGWYLVHSTTPGDAENGTKYFIPKGDVLTQVKPRQHALFWADGEKSRGTFHTNFKLDPSATNWIGLYDGGMKLMDEVTIPAGTLAADQSYARVSDADPTWEIKGTSADKYVTPSTNNKTIDSNAKMEKFAQHDSNGVGMAISAMSVVFCGLFILFISFRIIGKSNERLFKKSLHKAREEVKREVKSQAAPEEAMAAIAMALHQMQNEAHDEEEMVLTIDAERSKRSPWRAKSQLLRENPIRK